MKFGRIICRPGEAPQLDRIRLTETALERARGLLGATELAENEGLLLLPCNSVHTLFMRFAIDVVFLDRSERIIRIVSRLQPYRFAGALRARGVLELRAGTAARLGLRPGDHLHWKKDSL